MLLKAIIYFFMQNWHLNRSYQLVPKDHKLTDEKNSTFIQMQFLMPELHKMFLYAGSFLKWDLSQNVDIWSCVCHHCILLESHGLCDIKQDFISFYLIYSRTFYILRLKPQLLSGGQTMQENACSGESQLESVSALKSFMPYTCTDN